MKSALMMILALSINTAWGCEDSGIHSQQDLQEQQHIGAMVQSLKHAIRTPSPESLDIVVRYGTDSRYYTMIRGWLVQELSGVESQLASQNEGDNPEQDALAAHLRACIRRIDLE
ncbi:hypothetical protein [Shewanella algidipiscicola]|uniref:hypothetical protein n=1 Tax=Shewanella algidipiscicola TaxID=614070 RepID=UPI000D786D68|nr:hypothetical protein [Shewanella algidipiscicola]